MSDLINGMARAICLAIWDHDYTPRDPLHPDARWLQAMKAAKAGAGFLADNVSDEMVYAYLFAPNISGKNVDENVRKSISAALRAAGDGR